MLEVLPIRRLSIHSLRIPLKKPFEHASARRTHADPIVVAVELSERTVGYGETCPREYVTGESQADVLRTIEKIFVPLLVEMRPSNFGEALEAISELPCVDPDGRKITAARAAVELALLDAYSQAFDRSLEALAGWLGEPGLGLPGSHGSVRFSGVISGDDPKKIGWSIRKMRLYGLRDFKLKVGDEHEEARLSAATRALGGGLKSGKLSLRLDANGGWDFEQAVLSLVSWSGLPIAYVEQPLAQGQENRWSELKQRSKLPLMADESLVTTDDARRLIEFGGCDGFNLRVSKNGGLLTTLQLASLARKYGIQCQLGCMVGETSILSAAGRWLLQLMPGICFAEGSYGSFLLSDDVVSKPLRFGYGGKWQANTGSGLGVIVDVDKLNRLGESKAIEIAL